MGYFVIDLSKVALIMTGGIFIYFLFILPPEFALFYCWMTWSCRVLLVFVSDY